MVKKKAVKKKSVAKKKVPVKKEAKKVTKKPIGKISHYFDKIGVAVVELNGTLKVGDTILIEGHDVSFEQKIDSMEKNHKKIKKAKKRQRIALKTKNLVRENDKVFLVR